MSTALARIRSLRTVPRELWLVYALKIIESFVYFSSTLNLTRYLRVHFLYSDVLAGTLYGVWGVSISAYGLICSPLIDALGVRWSLILGGIVCTLGRLLFAVADTRARALFALFVLVPLGQALGIPVLTIAVQRVTDNQTRSVAFSAFYACMNIGALFAGLFTDAFLAGKSPEHALTALYMINACIGVLYTLLTVLFFRDLPVVADGQSSLRGRVCALLRDGIFWRVLVFSVSLFGARTIFRHIDTTLPAWMLRTLGADAHYGDVYAINPAIVIVGTVPLHAFLAEYDLYGLFVVGTTLCALAPMLLALFEPSYEAAVAFMLAMTAGEVVYSPKLYEFIMLLAPPGQEALFSALASLPLFFVKLLTGASSGELLETYCPEQPPRQCQLMWGMISAGAWTTPLLLLGLHRFLYTPAIRARIMARRKGKSVDEVLLGEVETADE